MADAKPADTIAKRNDDEAELKDEQDLGLSAERQQKLAISHSQRYSAYGGLHELETAIKYSWSAVTDTPVGDPDLPERHQILAISYILKYQNTRDEKALELSLRYNLSAEAATPEDHPNLPVRYQTLGISYLDRYRRTGNVKDLEKAHMYHLSCLAATPEGHVDLTGRHKNLSASHTARYHRTGDLEDIEAALGHNLSALAVTRLPKDHPDLAETHDHLGITYHNKYHRTGDPGDLGAAFKYNVLALSATPEDNPEWAHRHHGLASIYSSSYRRSQDLQDLESALKHQMEAIAKIPEDHPDLTRMHHNLAFLYRSRYEKIGGLEYLEAAIKCNLSAVGGTPEGHLGLPGRYESLAMSCNVRYTRTGDLEDLEAALKYSLTAVSIIPEGHPNLPLSQMSLAELYISRYKKLGHMQDLSTTNKLYKSALKSLNALPQDLWDISIAFTKHHNIFPSWDILNAYVSALNTLPSLLWLGGSLGNRHDTLIRNGVSGSISKAVSFALQNSRPSLAVEFLEQGLSTTHKQNLQLRDENMLLQEYLPTLSQKFNQVSVQLQGSAHTSDPAVNYHVLANQRLHLIAQIHQHPGFERFLLPQQYSHLCSAAEHGPVIILNCSDIQTDAILILSPTKPPLSLSLSLSDSSVSIIQKYAEEVKNALNQFSIHSRNIRYGRESVGIYNVSSITLLQSVTSWLWKAIVKPVFHALKENGIDHGRLWWCPSGPFTYLPLHAAAPLESNFIQSYTPTLETLIHANREHKPYKETDILTAIGVAEPSDSLGRWANLPAVENELHAVTMLFGKQAHQLKESHATIKNVVEEIQLTSWLHLACHGHQDLTNPLESGLVLYDGTLKLGKILDINLPNAKFVYLSACETAMGDSRLMNEAMHLAGGFLAAGFQGAIGTLWSMPDDYGPKVAEVVYKTILGDDSIPDVRKAAEGLHLAVQNLRREGAPAHQWMPFIHLGV